jgi:Ca2+/Na+ antiporter
MLILSLLTTYSSPLTLLYSRFHYILIGLIAVVVYLIYLIGYYKVQEYETDSFTNTLKTQSDNVARRNEEKEFLASLIHTPAYETLVAKSTQNKKLPGEEVINIVTEEEINGNADIDTHAVINDTIKAKNDPTRDMSNPEKWLWVVTRGIGG